VAPLLYWSLNTTCPEAVPHATLELLRGEFRANARQNLFLTSELVKIVHEFEANNIPAIPFKGPVLAALVYGNLALRQFGDLDIVLHECDLLRAIDYLVAKGYHTIAHGDGIPKLGQVSTQYDCLLVLEDGSIAVELQAGVFRWPFHFPPDFEQLWEDLTSTKVAGQQMRSFPPEDLLLHLCVHGSKHRWTRLMWICDVAELLRTFPELDWEHTMRRAIQLGCQRMLFLGLLLAHYLLGVGLSAAVLQQAQADRTARLLVADVCEILFDEVRDPDSFAALTPLFYLRMRERLRERVQLCVRLYPSLLRPLQLVRRYRLTAVRALFGV